MEKAVIMLVHKDSEQCNFFIKQLLFDEEITVFIHVNKKNEELKQEILTHDRVIISNNNIEITWGKHQILQAQLILLREVLAYDRYAFIMYQTGQDLLIKAGLDKYLEEHKDTCFIDSALQDERGRAYLLQEWADTYIQLRDSKLDPIRIMRRVKIEMSKMGLPVKRKQIDYDTDNMKFYENNCWVGLPLEVAEYILDFLRDNPEYWRIYEGGLVPEEIFWSTLIEASPYKETIIRVNGKGKNLVYTKEFIDNHPPVFEYDDIDELESSGAYFARKFDSKVDHQVMDYFYNKIKEVALS